MKSDWDSPRFSRDVARRTFRPGKGYVMCSPKNGMREIRVESRLEQAVAHALELDPRVTSYRAQPFTLNLSTGEVLDQKPKRKPSGAVYYTPDMTCQVHDIPMVIEVKHHVFMADHSALFEKVRDTVTSLGMRFLVVTDIDLPLRLQSNLRLLNQYAVQCRSQIPAWAEALDKLDPGELVGQAAQALHSLFPSNHHLAAGILTGQISVDLRRHAIEKLDFDIEPARGSLSALEVLSYG